MSPATRRSVPPAASEGARTPVTPPSASPAWVGTPAAPLLPLPHPLRSRTSSSDSTTADRAARRAGRPAGRRSVRYLNVGAAPPGQCRGRSAPTGSGTTDLCELVGVQAGTADERSVDVRPGEDAGRAAGLDRSAVEDTDDVARLRAVALGEPRPQCGTDLLGVVGGGDLTGADGPHRLVGDHDRLAEPAFPAQL